MGHVEGHTAVIVCDASSEHIRLVEVDEIGIPAKGLGEDVGENSLDGLLIIFNNGGVGYIHCSPS